ncbi:DNA-binding protein [candidate division WS5 bacterium]|uniref:DNA-binding protein n=1 Tax=candidate division WS5 bacterium TaxID=2093353 RepID=A0A419DA18_9BACT|nr:MAG: DNA-binding protein [candidate division WS5 bacterium]
MVEHLMSVKEVSELLSINPWGVYRLASCGKIPSIKIGKLRRFRESEILAWIEKHVEEAKKEG